MSSLLALRTGFFLMKQYPTIYSTNLVIISHLELGIRQRTQNIRYDKDSLLCYIFVMRFGLRGSFC